MTDSQASLIELADQLLTALTAYWGLPPHLRSEETSAQAEVVVKQCLEIYAPYETPEDRRNALRAALELQAEVTCPPTFL